MRLTLWISGKIKPAELDSLINHYYSKLPKSWHCNFKIYSTEKELTNLPDSQILIFDQRGVKLNTEMFKAQIEQALNHSTDLNLLIGPPDGWSENFKLSLAKNSPQVKLWSLSDCVLSHNLALLLIMEQLYRVNSMFENHPYHRI